MHPGSPLSYSPVFSDAMPRGGRRLPRTPSIGQREGSEDRFFPPAAPPPVRTEYTWVAMDMADTFRPTTGDSERRNPPSVPLTRAARFPTPLSATADVGPGAYEHAAIGSVGKQVLSPQRSPPLTVFGSAGLHEKHRPKSRLGPGAYDVDDTKRRLGDRDRALQSPSFGVGPRAPKRASEGAAASSSASTFMYVPPGMGKSGAKHSFGTRAAWYPEAREDDLEYLARLRRAGIPPRPKAKTKKQIRNALLSDSPDSPDRDLDRPVQLFDPLRTGLVEAKTEHAAGFLSGTADHARPSSQASGTSGHSSAARARVASPPTTPMRPPSRDLFGKRTFTPEEDRRMRMEERDFERLAAIHAGRVRAAAEHAAREPIF